MHSLVAVVTIVESIPVTLGLHVVAFNLPVLIKVWHPLSQVFVVDHAAEIIQSQIVHLGCVTFREVDHLGIKFVVELPIMAGREEFESVSKEMTVKFHQKADQSNILGRHNSLMLFVVLVSETGICSGFEPVIVSIKGH